MQTVDFKKEINKEVCNECGRSVTFGSGFFVNRIVDLNSFEDRVQMGKSFPEGSFLCFSCDEDLTKERFAF